MRNLLMLGPKIVPAVGNERNSRGSLSPRLQTEKSQVLSSADRGDASENEEEFLPEALDLLERTEGNKTSKYFDNNS